MRIYLALALVGASVVSYSQTLMTAPPNNGSGGVFLDLTPTSQSLFLYSFQTYFSGTVGTTVDIEVYTRPGSYVGFDGSNAGWTLTQTVQGIRNGTTTLSAPIVLTSPILLAAGQTTGVYFQAINHSSAGIRYTGTGANPPQTTWNNADLTLFSDVARTGAIPFGGGRFSPRTFAGQLNYSPVPEPATIAAVGLGVAALIRRRKR